MVERMRAPGVAVAPRVARRLQGRLEILLRKIAPEVKPLEEEVATPETKIRFEEIVREIDRAPREVVR